MSHATPLSKRRLRSPPRSIALGSVYRVLISGIYNTPLRLLLLTRSRACVVCRTCVCSQVKRRQEELSVSLESVGEDMDLMQEILDELDKLNNKVCASHS